MSLLDNLNKQRNPAQKRLQWSPKTGKWVYYDKDQGGNIEMPDTIQFIILDIFKTVKGFHEGSQSGIYANEVKFLQEQPLTVKTFSGLTLGVGLYADIKEKIKAEGAKFMQSVYVALFDENGEAEIAKLMIGGLNNQTDNPAKNQPASPWVKLRNKFRGQLIESTKGEKIKVAGADYYRADFQEAKETPVEMFESSILLAQKLKEYTDAYQDTSNLAKEELAKLEDEFEVEAPQVFSDDTIEAETVNMPF